MDSGALAIGVLLGVVLIAAGLAILARVRVRTAALILATLLLLSVVLLYVPRLAVNPYQAGMITNMFKAIAFCGGALTLARSVTSRVTVSEGIIDRLLPLGRYLFASFRTHRG